MSSRPRVAQSAQPDRRRARCRCRSQRRRPRRAPPCMRARLSEPEIHWKSPEAAAAAPLRLAARHFRRRGRPVSAVCGGAGSAGAPPSASGPSSRRAPPSSSASAQPGPCRRRARWGSSEAITTRTMPAATSPASAHGGWAASTRARLPAYVSGGPAGLGPRCARGSPRAPPPPRRGGRSSTREVEALADRSPLATRRAPTSRSGLTLPRPPSASSSARRRCARSVPVSWAFIRPIDVSQFNQAHVD